MSEDNIKNESNEIAESLLQLYQTLKFHKDEEYLKDEIDRFIEEPEMSFAFIMSRSGLN